jgi:hypothetical protein
VLNKIRDSNNRLGFFIAVAEKQTVSEHLDPKNRQRSVARPRKTQHSQIHGGSDSFAKIQQGLLVHWKVYKIRLKRIKLSGESDLI